MPWPQSMQAGGNIGPYKFVNMPDTAGNDWIVVQSSGATLPYAGVTSPWVRYAPGTPYNNGFVATIGQDVMVNGPGCLVDIEAGAAVGPGDLLMSDANGNAIPATGSGAYYGAQAMETASASGQIIRAVVLSPAGLP